MKNLKLFLLSTSILFSSQVFAMEESQEDLNQQLFQAIENKDLKQVKVAIQASADVNAKNNKGWTVLMYAVCFQPKAVKYLIQTGADINAKNNNGHTALMFAAGLQPEVVKDLIQAGADVNVQNNKGWTALITACKHHIEAVKDLIQAGANVNVQNNYGLTALTKAAENQPEAVKYLVLAGADLNQIKDYPNAYRVAFNIQNLVKTLFALLKNYKNNRIQIVNITKSLSSQVTIRFVRDLNRNTLLHYAAINEDVQLFKLIYFICPSLIAVANNSGVTPVELALGNYRVFNFIRDLYSSCVKDQMKKLINLCKNYDKAEESDKNIIKNMVKSFAMQGILNSIKDSDGNNLLHIAAIKEDVQLFGLIYSICPSLIATTNNDDQTPVQIALGNEKIFELIKKLASNQNQGKENFEDHQSNDDDDDDSV